MDAALESQVRQVFLDRADEALALLGRYGTETWHLEVDRVQRDIAFLAGGDVERVAHFVDMACTDYRDVIMFAEYPPDPDARRMRDEIAQRFGLTVDDG